MTVARSSPLSSARVLAAGVACALAAGVPVGSAFAVPPPPASQLPPGAAPPTPATAAANQPSATGTDLADVPAQVRDMQVEFKLGNLLPLELEFTNSAGQPVTLRDYFDQATKPGTDQRINPDQHRPVVMVMAYYDCPFQCGVVIAKMGAAVNESGYLPGRDYRVVVVSFNPAESTSQAQDAKDLAVLQHTRWATPQGPSTAEQDAFQFHTATAGNSRELARALGFPYKPDPNRVGDFIHPSVIFVLTPDGRISRYLDPMGSGMSPEKLAESMKLALLEASDGKIAQSLGERIMNFCYMYDPKAGAYTLQAVRVMQIGGALTLAAILTLVGGLEAVKRFGTGARAALPASPSPSPQSKVPAA